VSESAAGQGYESRFITSSDGLKLHVRVYGQPVAGRLPLLCLAGLSRNAGDFDVLARSLAGTRQVICPDYRGRGQSEWDPTWQNYAVPVEVGDVLAVTTVLGIERAVFLGTSRGGLITMVMSAVRPTLIAGAILNDIGPVVDGTGLARIKSYLGRMPQPKDFGEAVAFIKSIGAARFPAISDEDWMRQARSMWHETEGRLVQSFDPALTKPLEAVSFDQPMPTLWPQFDGLADVPVLAIRAENSDIIAPETVDAMAERHKRFESYIVPGQGHAPMLVDQPSIERVAAFLLLCDGARAA
jgi:pimeloyl-ACP methyl ester carboxylesterase